MSRWIPFVRWLLPAILVSMLLACGGGGTDPVTPTPLTITAPPQDATVDAGAVANFTVAATGGAGLRYQWQRGGVDVAGATSPTLTIAAVALADTGAQLRVVVSDGNSSVTSSPATLTVRVTSSAEIGQQPASVSVTAGQDVAFSVALRGATAPSYQWRRDGVDIAAANAATLTLAAVSASDNGARFSVRVTDGSTVLTSQDAVLTVSAASAPTSATGPRISAAGESVGSYTLAVQANGSVLVVGSNSTLGGHSPLGSFTPTTALAGTSARTVTGLQASSVSAGNLYALAVGTDGRLYGWGVSNGGTLGGNVVNGYVDTPTALAGATGVTMAVAGATHSVALKSDGTLSYWPGTTSFSPQAVTMGQVAGLTNVSKIVPGPAGISLDYREPIAIKSDGTAWTISWSLSTTGLVQTDTAVVRQITGLAKVADIACSLNHCLALLTDGTVQAWGGNGSGQLGNGTTTGGSSIVIPSGGATAAVSPATVPILSNVRAIAAAGTLSGGDSASIAITADGSVWTWGSLLRSGQGSNVGSALSPTKLSAPTGAVSVSCGVGQLGVNCVVLLGTGATWGWGANSNGELGDGSTTPRYTPVQATGINLN